MTNREQILSEVSAVFEQQDRQIEVVGTNEFYDVYAVAIAADNSVERVRGELELAELGMLRSLLVSCDEGSVDACATARNYHVARVLVEKSAKRDRAIDKHDSAPRIGKVLRSIPESLWLNPRERGKTTPEVIGSPRVGLSGFVCSPLLRGEYNAQIPVYDFTVDPVIYLHETALLRLEQGVRQ